MVNDFTAHLNLPLPAAGNLLADDVERIRDAFGAIDNKLHALDQLLASDDATLDQVQELVGAIKANRDTITSLLTYTATKDEVAAVQQRVTNIETNLLIGLY